MKKIVITIAFALSVLGLQAQNRKHVANFPLFQQYFNPSLTGYEGSMVKTYYRNQWTGYEDAPKTIFASAELDLADVRAWQSGSRLRTAKADRYSRQAGAAHAFGLAVLRDEFGPFSETQLHLSYGMRVRLSEKLALRWGGAATYRANRLDGNRLVVDNESDPIFQDYLGSTGRTGKADVNLGLTMSTDDFYLGYAMQDVLGGKLLQRGDSYLDGTYARHHVVQAGYRTALSEQVGLVANSVFRYDDFLKETVEGQLKGVFANTFWASAGYRKDLAYTFGAGARLSQFQVSYIYEAPVQDAGYMGRATNEVSLTYNLIPVKYPKYSRKITLW
ncbi:PorP/SprF family type IX secretion system membrane protein [Pontibacter chinhatensis]|uniref:Type IX secretion system membrane protein, PorP/SprF family n=1 Tax=Pontibacter chinhatensis TaxID=1436961 RepID=A0A1I2XUT3_9BACT|nr:PorP/SprF family type IX secretion system membrane protein [Pontibacter chinhatensis]SFH16857.1 type IX secretion system membrane protein, PorP/SprF family [Pontibacter chinhatensis]